MSRNDQGQFCDPFADSFMTPEIIDGYWYQVDTTEGTEAVDAYYVGHEGTWESLRDYLRGDPMDAESPVPSPQWGYGVRMSAPGCLDCTDWCFFTNKKEAYRFLVEMYGDE